MKVLVLTTTFPRWLEDTEPRFVLKLSETLTREGHEMLILAPHAPGAHRFEEWSGLKIHRFRYFLPERWERLCYEGGILPNLRSSVLAWLNLPLFLLNQGWAIGHLICKERVSLIHVHWILPQGLFALLWSRWFKVPVITTIHGSDLFVFGRGVMGWIVRFVLRRSAAVTVNSPVAESYLPSEIMDRVRLLPMGVDFDLFHPGDRKEAKARLGLTGTVLLGVGRLSEQKGFRYLVEALPFVLKEVPEIRLLLIGEGPEREQLVRLVKDLGLEGSVEFRGALPHRLLADCYRASDIVLLPSIRTERGEEEGLGLVLAEAMASGVPVIGTRTGGIPSIVEDGITGLLVPERDPKALAEGALRLLSDATLRERVIQGGMAHVRERFDWERIAQGFDRIYREVGNR